MLNDKRTHFGPTEKKITTLAIGILFVIHTHGNFYDMNYSFNIQHTSFWRRRAFVLPYQTPGDFCPGGLCPFPYLTMCNVDVIMLTSVMSVSKDEYYSANSCSRYFLIKDRGQNELICNKTHATPSSTTTTTTTNTTTTKVLIIVTNTKLQGHFTQLINMSKKIFF